MCSFRVGFRVKSLFLGKQVLFHSWACQFARGLHRGVGGQAGRRRLDFDFEERAGAYQGAGPDSFQRGFEKKDDSDTRPGVYGGGGNGGAEQISPVVSVLRLPPQYSLSVDSR